MTLANELLSGRGNRNRAGQAVNAVSWAIHIPGIELEDGMFGPGSGISCSPEEAHKLLGRKGLLGKDAASLLALCAVHKALNLQPGAPRPRGAPDPRTAVVASSNFGNVATVQNIVRTLDAGGWRQVSALDAPNASSNVLASTVAIWFRFGGPNLMLCSGATSGLDAIALACILLRSGRADRVIVVGAEPQDPATITLNERRLARARKSNDRFCAAAAAVVLALAIPTTTEAVYVGPIQSGLRLPDDDAYPSAIVGPSEFAIGNRRAIDVASIIGDSYGAVGVIQVAIAAHLVAMRMGPCIAVVCGDQIDGWKSTIIRAQS